MYPQYLIGEMAIRKRPVEIVLEKVTTLFGSGEFAVTTIDRSFTDKPVYILAATDSHVLCFPFEAIQGIQQKNIELGALDPIILGSDFIDDHWENYSLLIELTNNHHTVSQLLKGLSVEDGED